MDEAQEDDALVAALASAWPVGGEHVLCEHGYHHHDGPHACDWGDHDDACPWRRGVRGFADDWSSWDSDEA